MPSHSQAEWIVRQAEHFTGEPFSGRPVIFSDTTNFMYIDRGHIVELEGEMYLVRGNEREGRFGLEEQPKFWVKRALSLNDGKKRILKLVCQETFKVQIGTFQVTCSRSGEKEGQVLDFVRSDRRFMQGCLRRDSKSNPVRVIDLIDGLDLLNHICSLSLSHEQYFREHLPSLLARTIIAFQAIQRLNENGFCHGDIRNDHIIVERKSGEFRWIDFDLTQDFSDFDLWSLGNILHCIVGKGFVNFRNVVERQPQLSGMLSENDASAFFPHRVMNLAKVYPYIPKDLNRVLLRFSLGAPVFYNSISQVVEELGEAHSRLETRPV